MYGVVYLITNSENGKQYVGQTTTSLSQRWYGHVRFSKRRNRSSSVALANAISKYGPEKFHKKILHECETKAELDEKEQHFIEELGTLYPNGYNLREGGQRGKHTQKTINKLSIIAQNRTPEHNARISEALKGKKLPDWHVEKLKESNRGRKKTPYELRRLRESKLGHLNPNYGKYGEDNSFYGKKHTEEAKEKCRAGGKINRKTAVKIREIYAAGKYTQQQVAEMFELSTANICLIVNGKTWPEKKKDDPSA